MKSQESVRIIFHIDLNMFYCSVAVIKNPSLKGKAFAIGRENSYKGVISTSSYKAREFGIHSAMALVDAFKILPKLIVVNPEFELYKEYHNKFVNLIKEYSDTVSVASIDEVYADMTNACKNIHPTDLAKLIQTRLIKEFKLPSSIGIAPTLFLAKMASDVKKPLGITILRKREVSNIIGNLNVKEIYGIGKKTYPKLLENNINTINEFLNINNKNLIINLLGEKLYNQTLNNLTGNSTNIIDPNKHSIHESISTSQTYDTLLSTYEDVFIELRKMTKSLYDSLIKKEYYTKTISITLRDHNFKTITRSKTIDLTNSFSQIMYIVEELLDENYKNQELRLVGVGFANLTIPSLMELEYNLFTYQTFEEKNYNINKLINEYNLKYGNNFIKIGIK